VDGVIAISTGRCVRHVAVDDDRVVLTLDDGSRREVDHILLGTGYEVDIAGYPFLGEPLLGSILRAGGYPKLSRGFESSVAGLYFLGAPAAWSYGPLLRFVAGSGYASAALTRHLHKSPARRAVA
jgi:hypothetical protein